MRRGCFDVVACSLSPSLKSLRKRHFVGVSWQNKRGEVSSFLFPLYWIRPSTARQNTPPSLPSASRPVSSPLSHLTTATILHHSPSNLGNFSPRRGPPQTFENSKKPPAHQFKPSPAAIERWRPLRRRRRASFSDTVRSKPLHSRVEEHPKTRGRRTAKRCRRRRRFCRALTPTNAPLPPSL